MVNKYTEKVNQKKNQINLIQQEKVNPMVNQKVNQKTRKKLEIIMFI